MSNSPRQISGIYKITNQINGKCYIGSSNNIESRWQHHKSNLRKNKHSNTYLQNAWDKYGKDSFEFTVIEEVKNIGDLLEREQYYMDKMESEYNIAPKANRSKMSEETRHKISKANKGKNHPNYGKDMKGEKNPCSKLPEKDVKSIKYLLNGSSLSYKQIGKIFGMSKGTINDIEHGRSWSHVEI